MQRRRDVGFGSFSCTESGWVWCDRHGNTHTREASETLLMEISGVSTVKVERSFVEALNFACRVPVHRVTAVVAQIATC